MYNNNSINDINNTDVMTTTTLIIKSNHNSNNAGDNNVTDSNRRANILATVSILQFSLFTISVQRYTENKVLSNEM